MVIHRGSGLLQRLVEHSEKAFHVDRFGDVIGGAALHEPIDLTTGGIGAKDDDRDGGAGGIGP